MRAGSFNELGVIMRPGMAIKKRKTENPSNSEDASTNEISVSELGHGKTQLKISIRRLEINASVGVYDFEKNRQRPLVLDIEVGLSPDYLVQNDQLKNTIDYDFLANAAHELAQSAHFNLVETFAQELSKKIIQSEKIATLNLKIEKPDAVSGSLSSCVELNWVRN